MRGQGIFDRISRRVRLVVADDQRLILAQRREQRLGKARVELGGRLGFLVTPWVLVYGTGGVAFGSVSGSFSYSAHEIDGFGFASAVF